MNSDNTLNLKARENRVAFQEGSKYAVQEVKEFKRMYGEITLKRWLNLHDVDIKVTNLDFAEKLTGHKNPEGILMKTRPGYQPVIVLAINSRLSQTERQIAGYRLIGYHLFAFENRDIDERYVYVLSKENTPGKAESWAEGVATVFSKSFRLGQLKKGYNRG